MDYLLFITMLLVSFISIMLFYYLFGLKGLFGWIGVAIIISNIQAVKLIHLFGATITAGGVLYATTFLVTDIISEIYGKRESKKCVYIGLLAMASATLIMQITLRITPDIYDNSQKAMQKIFSVMPKIMLASITAYIVSQLHDVWAFHFWKKKTKNKYLWFRNNTSTMVSQLIDAIIFFSIVFIGKTPPKVFIQILISAYILKWIIAVSDTPFVYLARWLYKKGYYSIADKIIKTDK